MAKNQNKKNDKISHLIRYASYFFASTGGLLLIYFVAIGGPNKGQGRHLLNNNSNPYLDLQVALVLLALGIAIPLVYKLVKNLKFGDSLLDIFLKLELGIIGLALLWLIIVGKTLAGVLAYFILYLLVPIIPVVVVLSVMRYKIILRESYNRLKFLAIVTNWVALVFMIVNVAD